MSMVRQKWSVNAIAKELRVDRRTVARHLHEVKAAGSGPHGPLYFMGDVHHALTAYCSECRKDSLGRAFIEHVGKRPGLEVLAERLAAAASPDARVRILREYFASHFWSFIRGRKDPICPDWASASQRNFERAWRALVRWGEPLADVLACVVGAGGKDPPEW